jgi:hypothetical protein
VFPGTKAMQRLKSLPNAPDLKTPKTGEISESAAARHQIDSTKSDI